MSEVLLVKSTHPFPALSFTISNKMVSPVWNSLSPSRVGLAMSKLGIAYDKTAEKLTPSEKKIVWQPYDLCSQGTQLKILIIVVLGCTDGDI